LNFSVSFLRALLCSSVVGVLFFPVLYNESLLYNEINKSKYANHITLESKTPFGTLDIIGKPLMSTHCRTGGPFSGQNFPIW